MGTAGAKVFRLRAHRTKLRREQADAARQRVLALDMPEPIKDDMLSVIEGWSPSGAGWTFVMLSAEQNRAVVGWLRRYSASPLVALELWAVCFEHQRRGTNEIRATRQELADAVGTNPAEVSRIMGELVSIGAITRSYEGRRVSYRMNAAVSTKLTGRVRDRAQAASPPLSLTPRKKREKPARKSVQSHLSVVPPAAPVGE